MHRASIGDTLLATPVYRAIKETYPQAETVVLTSPTGYELLLGNPYIDELVSYEKGDSIFFVLNKIWRSDVAIILDHHYRDAMFAFLALIPKRIGRGKDFINVHVDDPPLKTYEPWKYLNISKQAGIDTTDITLTRPIATSEEKSRVQDICDNLRRGKKGKIVLIAPYSLDSLKDWEPENYNKIIQLLRDEGQIPVVIGGKEHFQKAEQSFPQATNLMGKTNLRETTELISQADLLVCGCTSVLHICATTDTTSVAIYGPSSPLQWAPKNNCIIVTRDFSCSPCHNISPVRCEKNRCIQEISIDEVWDKIRLFL